MYELINKTETLDIQVLGIYDLEDVDVKCLHPPPQYPSLCNLVVLSVSNCADLRFLFTFFCATALSKLEHLKVSLCPWVETLIRIESGRVETFIFKVKVSIF